MKSVGQSLLTTLSSLIFLLCADPMFVLLRASLCRYLDPDPLLLQDEANGDTNPKFAALNQAIVSLVRLVPSLLLLSLRLLLSIRADEYRLLAVRSEPFRRVQIEDHNLVSFLPLDTSNPDSVNTILSHLDNAMQYGEDEEPKMPKDMDEGDFGGEDE